MHPTINKGTAYLLTAAKSEYMDLIRLCEEMTEMAFMYRAADDEFKFSGLCTLLVKWSESDRHGDALHLKNYIQDVLLPYGPPYIHYCPLDADTKEEFITALGWRVKLIDHFIKYGIQQTRYQFFFTFYPLEQAAIFSTNAGCNYLRQQIDNVL